VYLLLAFLKFRREGD